MRFGTLISVVLSTALSLSLPLPAQSAPGDLDSSFGGVGKVTADFGVGDDQARATAVQADGKIVAAGFATSGPNPDEVIGHTNGSFDFAVVRYNTDGSLDNTFGAGGKVTTSFGHNDISTAVAIQSDGKIVVAGSNNHDFLLVRYNTDGSLDTNFGAEGKVTTDSGFNGDCAYALGIQGDGKMIIAGTADSGTSNYLDFFIARYNPDGSPDNTFGSGGKTATDFNAGFDTAQAMALQVDGKIIVAGWTLSSGPSIGNEHIVLARYSNDGSLDNTFGTGGKVITDNSGVDNLSFTIAIQHDGKILVTGFSSDGTNTSGILMRYNSDGSLDTDFGNAGKVTTNLNADNNGVSSIAVESNGKILLSIWTGSMNSNSDFLARYNTDGSLDSSFGLNGKAVVDMWTNTLTLQMDEKIVLGGSSYNGNNYDFALARYLGDTPESDNSDSGGLFGCGATLSNPSKGSMSQGLDLLAEIGLLYLWVTFRKMRRQRRVSAYLHHT